MELEKSMRIYRSMGLSKGSNTLNTKLRSSPGRSRTCRPWGDTWLRCRVVSIWVFCVQGSGQFIRRSLWRPERASQACHGAPWSSEPASLMHGEPSLPPHSRHLGDVKAALHDQNALSPAACGQKLRLGVAAPLLEQLARSRWTQCR